MRYEGCLMGLAAGDALGTTLEFKPPGTFAPLLDMVGGGPFHLEPGQWTDDTSMALCLAESLLTLSLGNLQPDDLIVVRLAYVQTLTRLPDWTSFQIPFCPGVRYIPGTPLLRAPKGRGVEDDTDEVPDASRISPPRMDRLHPDAAYMFAEGVIAHPADEVRAISSPSQATASLRPSQSGPQWNRFTGRNGSRSCTRC